MAKNPVLPLYYNDMLGATKTWTDEEFGAYMRLLIEQWDKGGLPNDFQRLTRIATSLTTTWPMLKEKFPLVDGLLKNANMEVIRQKRAKYSEKQSDNIRKRYQNSTKPPTKNIPLEKENETEYEKEGIGVQREGGELSEVDVWNQAALDKTDHILEQMEINDARSTGKQWPSDFDRAHWILHHRGLVSRYGWQFSSQQDFRQSLLSELRKNKFAKPDKSLDVSGRKKSFNLSEV